MGLTRLIFNRLAFGLVTLVVITILISLALEALPGDFAEQRLGQSATPETIAAIRDQLGLNEPIHIRYLEWLGKFLQGDMGVSLSNSRPVSELLATRLGNTVFLAASAAVVAVPLALILGYSRGTVSGNAAGQDHLDHDAGCNLPARILCRIHARRPVCGQLATVSSYFKHIRQHAVG